jgi:hypothetical protein
MRDPKAGADLAGANSLNSTYTLNTLNGVSVSRLFLNSLSPRRTAWCVR